MMETLKECLNYRLKLATEGVYGSPRTWYDQAFGMVTLFLSLYPDLENEAVTLWEDVYKPAFDEIFLK